MHTIPYALAGGLEPADLFEHLPQAVFLCDRSEQIVYANPAGARLLGHPADELCMTPLRRWLVADVAAAALPRTTHPDAAPGAFHRLRFRRADGEVFLTDTVIGPVLGADQVVGSVLVVRVASVAERAMNVLEEMHQVCSDAAPLDERIGRLLTLGSKHLGLPLAIQSRIEGHSYVVERCASPDGALAPGTHFELGVTYCSLALAEEGPVGFHYMGSLPQRRHPCYQTFGLEAYLGCRVEVDGALYGTVNFSSPEPSAPFSPEDYTFVALLGRWVGTAIAEERMARRLEALSRTDPLTGLLNRRGVEEQLGWLRAHHERSGLPLGVVALDLDHFKSLNDRFGHAVGDAALQAVADVLRAVARASDHAGRVGGEELLLVLPDTGLAGAIQLAERVRRQLSAIRLSELGGEEITASFGVAVLRPGERVEDLLRRADLAMYDAKQQGRDRVVASPGGGLSTGATAASGR